nr:class I SAM-dependent methyltransferase [Sediminivirga luteola]
MYDLIAEGYVDPQLSALGELLTLVDVQNGPILDIGCGSGRHLAHVLEALPAAQAIGLEPSDAMRSLALGRLAANLGWRDRVTIRTEGALEAPLPDQLSGVIMFGVFGHFTRFERSELIARLAGRLPEGGAILLDLQLPEEPAEIAPYVVADTHLGALRYRCLAEGAPLEGEAMQWRMTYQTLDGDAVIENHTGESIFHHPRHELVREEMRAHGLTLTRLPDTTYWLAVRNT